MLGYWIFAVCYLLTIAYLVYLIERQRRRTDAIKCCLESTTKAIERLWCYIKNKEQEDAKEGKE